MSSSSIEITGYVLNEILADQLIHNELVGSNNEILVDFLLNENEVEIFT